MISLIYCSEYVFVLKFIDPRYARKTEAIFSHKTAFIIINSLLVKYLTSELHDQLFLWKTIVVG